MIDKRQQRTANVISVLIIVAIYIAVFVAEQCLPPRSMLFTVLKKGAVYALVAVAMNLLNGFTGIFSLGQAGFMLIGAYVYCIFTIPAPSCTNTSAAASSSSRCRGSSPCSSAASSPRRSPG